MSYVCPFEYALTILSGKWKGLVIFYLGKYGTMRNGEIKKKIPHVTQKVLTDTLRFLESEGMITREVYPVLPPKVEYSLTKKGQSILPILHSLQVWGESHVNA